MLAVGILWMPAMLQGFASAFGFGFAVASTRTQTPPTDLADVPGTVIESLSVT